MIYKKLLVILFVLIIIYLLILEMPYFETSERIFPEKIGDFKIEDIRIVNYSRNNYVTVWCASPAKNFIAETSYRITYAKEDKLLDVDVFVPKNKEDSKKCFDANSEFFSKNKDFYYERIPEYNAFFIDGNTSSKYVRSIFLLDNESNYIVFSQINESVSNFISKKDIIDIVSKFKVR